MRYWVAENKVYHTFLMCNMVKNEKLDVLQTFHLNILEKLKNEK